MPLRRWLASILPLVVLATATAGTVYVVAQQGLRAGANDPQIQMAEGGAARLISGASPASIAGSDSVDLARSLAPFTVVYDAQGSILASDGLLDGQAPHVPAGVAETATNTGIDKVTWQPRGGVRIATVTVPWSGGTITVGRSLRVVEQQIDQLGLLIGVCWLATLGALGLAIAGGHRLIGSTP